MFRSPGSASATGLASGRGRQGEGPNPRQECKHGALTPLMHTHTLVSVGQMQGSLDPVDFFASYPNSVPSGEERERVESDRSRAVSWVQ